MRIIKQGKPKEEKRTVRYVCDNCGAEIEVEIDESLDCCPCCGKEQLILLPGNEDKASRKPLSAGEAFPEKYFRFGVSDGAAKLPDERIRNMIDETVQTYLRSNCGYCYRGTGDTFIAVFQSDKNDINDYFVVVGKNYYEINSCELEDDSWEEEEDEDE